jgi:hypothetical protein
MKPVLASSTSWVAPSGSIGPTLLTKDKAMPAPECLMVFTRYPEPGTTKTRLIPHLGARGAADIQRRMTEHVLAQARPLMTSRGLDLEVHFEGGDTRRMRAWLGDALTFIRQGEGDIGRRMEQAFDGAVDRGRTSMAIVGTDIPDISTALLERAFEMLCQETIVLGPAVDGGYYFIGLPRKVYPRAARGLFADLPWGTSVVLAESCRRLQRLGLAYRLLDRLADVDRPEDLPVWERWRRK